MTNDDDNNYNAGDRHPRPDFRSDAAADNERRQPVLDDFDEEETYEESDRDTDYASIYTEDILEDDEIEELLQGARSEPAGAEDTPVTANQPGNKHYPNTGEQSQDGTVQATASQWDDEDLDEDFDDPGPRWSGTDPREEFIDEFEAGSDDNELWDDEDDYDSEERATWPLGLIAVAIVALLLLGAGGYGVIQQRAAMETEIRELQAALATAASPEDVAASRQEVTKMRSQYEELRITLNSLNLENRRLRDTVSGLESQLAAQQDVTKTAAKVAAPQPAAPKPAKPKQAAPKPATPQPAAPQPATPKPAAAVPAATASTGAETAVASGWFVNFGSYSKQATAESWSTRLKPPAGKVIVTTGDKAGTTFYRVRVVSLSSKEQAENVARNLEKSYGLSRLWVGKQ